MKNKRRFYLEDYSLVGLTARLEDGCGNVVELTAVTEGAGAFLQLRGRSERMRPDGLAEGAALSPAMFIGLCQLGERLVELADDVNGEGEPE